MSGIFDRLQKQLDIARREQGISPLEIADLPPNLRKVMRIMLREVVMRIEEIEAAVAALPPANRLSPQELEQSLAKLVEQNWLTRLSAGEYTSYRVNLRRRAGSQLSQDIWSALDARLGGENTKPTDQE